MQVQAVLDKCRERGHFIKRKLHEFVGGEIQGAEIGVSQVVHGAEGEAGQVVPAQVDFSYVAQSGEGCLLHMSDVVVVEQKFLQAAELLEVSHLDALQLVGGEVQVPQLAGVIESPGRQQFKLIVVEA